MSDVKMNDKAVLFVSDWKERMEKHQRKYFILSVVAFFAAFFVCIFLFLWFQNKNYERIVSQNKKYIQDSAIQEANQIERELGSAKLFIMNFASQYEDLVRLDDNLSIEECLEILNDKNIFDRLAFISEDGTDTSLEGVANVADRDYFNRGMKGETGWELVEKSRVTGKPTVIFYTPVEVNNKIIGVMAGFYERERLEDLFYYHLFNYTPRTYLLQGDGMVVATSRDDEVTGNMLEELSKKRFVGDVHYGDITEAIADSDRTTISFSFVDDRATSVGVIVQFTHSDWMLLSVLPNDITSGMVNNANRPGRILLVVIVVVFLLLITMLFLFFENQKRRLENAISNAVENLEETLEEEARQLSIIESLGEVYSSVYYVDLENSRYQRIKDFADITTGSPDEGDAATGFNSYIDRFVSDADKEDMYKFLQVDTLRQRLEQHGSESIEYQRNDGSWRRATIVAAGTNEAGAVIAMVYAVSKIDFEKKKEIQTKRALQEAYEAAQLASNAKTTFLSNMSHDIRTPMNAIVGMTAIAAANLDNTEKLTDCLKKITSSSKHLLGLINEVLDMSKIESGKVDLSEEEFSLPDLIENLIAIHQPLIKEKNHSLVVKINGVDHEDVVGDSTRLQQVFTNLLSNAIKYTPNGGRIEIDLTEKETNKTSIGWYEVIIKDNGIGMSEEFQQRLFEPFARADDARITQIQGTGLGMPITKNIIHMMNGDITVSSKLNEGTTFTVSFVLRLQTEAEVDYEDFVDLPILVADDDVVACESTCLMLDSLSMKSEWVTSGREALKKTIEHHENQDDYYAVILDWKMLDMSGIETAKQIRLRIGDEIPIIVISAYDWTDIEQEAREAGVNAFLSKPLFKSRLVSLFGELMGKKQNEDNVNTPEVIQQQDFTGKRILVVEDNEINSEIAVEILEMTGAKTETAENGKIATEMFAVSEKGYYDLILMDIQMPVMDGYDATKVIRSMSRPDAKKIPIVAMTANAFSADVRHAMKSGMNGHIAKPVDVKQLMKILNETLGD